MNQKELTLLYSYILNNQIRLKDEIRHLQSNLRFRNVDTVDCLELAFAIERYNTFREITKQIRILLNMEGKNDVVENSEENISETLKNREKSDII